MGAVITLNRQYIESAESTNSLLMQGSYLDRTCLYTFNQTKGKGRLNRSWQTGNNKNVALSVIFQELPHSSVWLTAVFSISLIDTLLHYNINSGWIKWPNDIFVRNSKIAGILTESVWQKMVIQKTVAGVGVNINATKDDLLSLQRDATSIMIETGKSVDCNEFTEIYIDYIEKRLTIMYNEGINPIRDIWRNYSKVIGEKAVLTEITEGSKPITGIITSIDDDGYLFIYDGKQTIKVVTGDINIL